MATNINSTGKWDYARYACIPDDGQRHEIIDGVHVVNPAPGTYHQTVSKRLQYHLYTQIELGGLGVVFNAPVDVQLSENDIVQPDLVVVLNSKQSIITPARIFGVPDLLVEILSPSSTESDRTLKRAVYERSGVPEYWIVNPFDHVLDQLVLHDGAYRLLPRSDEIRPTIAEGILMRLREIW